MNPLVSIIIPCYNAEPWLNETLESALSQTWENKEIIFIDDGSTDRSLQIAESYRSSGVIIISQDNIGSSSTRNRGLKESSGDYIQYLDADDLLATNKIELQIKLLEQNENKACIASGEWARFRNDPLEAEFDHQPIWKDLMPVEWLVSAWGNYYMMHPAAWLVPRNIAKNAGPWNEDLTLNDDGEYFSRVVLSSKKIKFCRGARSYYRSGNSKSLSATISENTLRSLFLSISLGVDHLLEVENSSRTRLACASIYQRFIYVVYPEVPELRKKAEIRIKQLGGTDIMPEGGPYFNKLTSLIGWKKATRIRRFVYGLGYKKLRNSRFINWDL